MINVVFFFFTLRTHPNVFSFTFGTAIQEMCFFICTFISATIVKKFFFVGFVSLLFAYALILMYYFILCSIVQCCNSSISALYLLSFAWKGHATSAVDQSYHILQQSGVKMTCHRKTCYPFRGEFCPYSQISLVSVCCVCLCGTCAL